MPTVRFVLDANLTPALVSLQNFLLPLGVAGPVTELSWNLWRTRISSLRVSPQPL